MGWKRIGNRRYFYRSEREGSRVRSVYLSGEFGEKWGRIAEANKRLRALERQGLEWAKRSGRETESIVGEFLAAVADDQHQGSRGRDDVFDGSDRIGAGTDMDRQEGGWIGGGWSRCPGPVSGARATGWESGAEAVEPGAKGVEGDAARRAELDVGHPRAAEVGEDGRPVDLAGRLSPDGASGN
jgi:hypothetical protein